MLQVFSLEYIIRLLVVPYVAVTDLTKSYDALSTYLEFGFSKAATVNEKDAFMESTHLSKPYKLWLFVKQPMNIIDVLAIAPFYIELAMASDNSESDEKHFCSI